jgi:hypothetical protein
VSETATNGTMHGPGCDEARAALSAALSLLEEADTYMREVAHVLDAAREIERHGRQSEIQNIAEWVQRLRGLEAEFSRALAALPVPPTERVRACLQQNGRSLEWPK